MSSGTTNLTWSNRTAPGTPAPSPRLGATMVYDAADGYVLLFGGMLGYLNGTTPSLSDETWTFTGFQWTNISGSAGTAPSSRIFGAATYDAAEASVLLYGGFSYYADRPPAGPEWTGLQDTWSFAHGLWTNHTPAVPQQPGWGVPALSYDPNERSVLLFENGGPYPNTSFNFVWAYSGGTWAVRDVGPRAPTSFFSPVNDLEEAMVFDAARNATVVFQPSTYESSIHNFTSENNWELLHGSWARISSSRLSSAPPLYPGSSVVYDSAINASVVLGNTYAGVTESGTWVSNGSEWARLPGPVDSFTHDPNPLRFGMAATYDPTSGCVLSFGGGAGSLGLTSYYGLVLAPGAAYSNETWSLCGSRAPALPNASIPTPVGNASWTNRTGLTGASPPGVVGAAMTYDALDGYVVEFGGYNSSPSGGSGTGETWKYSNGSWTRLLTAGPSGPPPRYDAQMTYDAANAQVLLFGGFGKNSLLNDTWSYSGGNWTRIGAGSGGSPPGLVDASLSYDAGGGDVVLTGSNASFPSPGVRQTWTFSRDRWSKASVAIVPGSSLGSVHWFDPAENVTVLLQNGTPGREPGLQRMLEFVNGTWFPLPSPGEGMGSRYRTMVAYDAVARGAVAFGGLDSLTGSSLYGGGTDGDTWFWAKGGWHLLIPSVTSPNRGPGPRQDAAMTYDPASGCVVLFGGRNDQFWTTYTLISETWTLCGGTSTWGLGNGSGLAPQLGIRLHLARSAGLAPFAVSGSVWVQGGRPPYTIRTCDGSGVCETAPVAGSWAVTPVSADYSVPGAYLLSVTAVDTAGASRTVTESIAVNARAPIQVSTVESGPPGGAPRAVGFLATVSGGFPPYSIRISFGDGSWTPLNPGTEVRHTYAAEGTFYPVLWVKDSAGAQLTTNLSGVKVANVVAAEAGPGSGLALGAVLPSLLFEAVGAAAALAAIGVYRRREDRKADELLAELRRPALPTAPRTPPGGS